MIWDSGVTAASVEVRGGGRVPIGAMIYRVGSDGVDFWLERAFARRPGESSWSATPAEAVAAFRRRFSGSVRMQRRIDARFGVIAPASVP